jgi:hypothetical protein
MGQVPGGKDANNNQVVIDRMVSRSVRSLTVQKNDAQAWIAIFKYFNRTHGRGNAGYRAGEKVAIKANLNSVNLCYRDVWSNNRRGLTHA